MYSAYTSPSRCAIPHSVGCLFTLFMVFFVFQTFLILTDLTHFSFYRWCCWHHVEKALQTIKEGGVHVLTGILAATHPVCLQFGLGEMSEFGETVCFEFTFNLLNFCFSVCPHPQSLCRGLGQGRACR